MYQWNISTDLFPQFSYLYIVNYHSLGVLVNYLSTVNYLPLDIPIRCLSEAGLALPVSSSIIIDDHSLLITLLVSFIYCSSFKLTIIECKSISRDRIAGVTVATLYPIQNFDRKRLPLYLYVQFYIHICQLFSERVWHVFFLLYLQFSNLCISIDFYATKNGNISLLLL